MFQACSGFAHQTFEEHAAINVFTICYNAFYSSPQSLPSHPMLCGYRRCKAQAHIFATIEPPFPALRASKWQKAKPKGLCRERGFRKNKKYYIYIYTYPVTLRIGQNMMAQNDPRIQTRLTLLWLSTFRRNK